MKESNLIYIIVDGKIIDLYDSTQTAADPGLTSTDKAILHLFEDKMTLEKKMEELEEYKWKYEELCK